MSNTPVTVPINPFVALQPHFGMLLGVDDLSTLQGYPTGKLRLHNAWLHRSGAVWGLAVERKGAREVRVQPGLAVDGWGRELHLAGTRCLDVARWYQLQRKELGLDDAVLGGRVTFEGQLVLSHAGCLATPVPAIAEGCSTGGSSLRYSRLRDEVTLSLRRPKTSPPRWHRLRVLFGLDAPASAEDQALLLERAKVLSGPIGGRPAAFEQLFRAVAADDELALTADDAGWPDDADAVVLASVKFELQRVAADDDEKKDAWELLSAAIDNHARQTLVATRTLQELLSGAAAAATVDAGGARFDPATITLSGSTLTLVATRPLAPGSFAAGFTVTSYDAASGWKAVPATVTADASRTVFTLALTLPSPLPADTWLRVVASGTGPTPLLTQDPLVPLAGAVGGPAGSATQGNDFTHFWKVS